MFFKNEQEGFTLIELLVVVAIIGILATVVLGSVGTAREKAQDKKERMNLVQIRTLANAGQLYTGKVLKDITLNSCSACSCPNATILSNLSPSHACVVNWKSAIDKIFLAGGNGSTTGVGFYTDTWGSPYVLDENEEEYPANPCRRDTLVSPGPDKTFNTGDDILIGLPYLNCEG